MIKLFALWVWNNLASEKTPFYQSPALQKFQAPNPPSATDWRGWKLKIWSMAKDYLVSIGELTYTPTLKEKF